MDDLITTISEKITSYNLFNNLLPGAIFCVLADKCTRLSFATSNILEQLFLWYFVGMIISRIGSIFVEKVLKEIKVIEFADYNKYTLAAEKNPYLKTMSEINNTYRTMIALLCCFGVVYAFDVLLWDWIKQKFANADRWVITIALLFLIIVFICSYRKQTEYIKKQVENTQI